MAFLAVLIASLGVALLLRKPIKRYPWLLYAACILVVVGFLGGFYLGMPQPLRKAMLLLIQKCMLPLALFTIVMFVGVLGRSTWLYGALKPIRAELSIMAWLLSLGHMAIYLASYLPRIVSGAWAKPHVTASFLLAIVLFVLLLVLGMTSFSFAKRHMGVQQWKKLQKLAYPFFLLVYVHLLLMLAPSAMGGAVAPVVTVLVYTVVFGIYVVGRLARSQTGRSKAPAMHDFEEEVLFA